VRDLAGQANTEHLQQAAQLVLQIHALAQDGSSAREQQSDLMTFPTLYMDAAIPTCAQNLRDAASIIAVRLVAHCCQRRAHLARLEANDLEARGLQPISQILGERTGLEADDPYIRTERAQTRSDAIDIGLNLRLMPNFACSSTTQIATERSDTSNAAYSFHRSLSCWWHHHLTESSNP
jgi:hypothetical protein